MSSKLSQMRRLDELEAHYAVKQRELSAVQREIAERQAKLEDPKKESSAAAASGGSGSEEEEKAKKKPTTSSSGPVPSVGRCSVVMSALADRKNVEFLPLYEAHNVSSALRAALDVENQTIANYKREIITFQTEYNQTLGRSTKAADQLHEFKRVTGFSTSKGVVAPTKIQNSNSGSQNNNNNNNNRHVDPVSSSSANANANENANVASSTSATSSPGSSPRHHNNNETASQAAEREKKELADSYILQLRKVEEHLKASRLLQKKLETSLKELDRAGSVQHETDMKVDATQNQCLVLDREIALKQAELLDIRNLQAGCDKELDKIEGRRGKESKILGMIHGEYRKVKNEASDVAEQRRQWDETIKAQDRRLGELRERKDIYDQSIDAHGLKEAVQGFVEAATAQRQAERSQPSPAEDLSDIISHYADVNMLAPAEEIVPQGIVTLLNSLHDKLAHRVRCKEVLVEEKLSSGEALKDHVDSLVREHDSSEDKLYIARADCEREVVNRVDNARNALSDFREEYNVVKGITLARQRKERHDSVRRGVAPKPDMKFKEKKTK